MIHRQPILTYLGGFSLMEKSWKMKSDVAVEMTLVHYNEAEVSVTSSQVCLKC